MLVKVHDRLGNFVRTADLPRDVGTALAA